MSKENQFIIRNASQDEVKSVFVDWAAQEGWNPGLYENDVFYAADPKGFYIGLLDDEPIACISAVAYDQNFAFIGFYIVKSEYRGKGYGLKIWNEAISHLKTQNIGLDGVIEQQDNYKKSGFKFAYSNIRYETAAQHTNEKFPEIIPISQISYDELLEYDSKLFPVPRPLFLKNWINQPESMALAAQKDNKIVGYSVIRKCINGFKIGPLFADNDDLANKLFLASGNFANTGDLIYLDVPEVNQSAIKLAENYAMKVVFGTARMYTGSQPDIDMNKIFGITTFELG